MKLNNDFEYISFSISTLKILGYGQTGVPVQVWPGAPFLRKSITYINNINILKLDQSSIKEAFRASTDTTVTPLEVIHG